ncbi:CMRF35-like molecule 2 [Mobula birostris]|uniref:CMRF35-like molecule 2 n=1 Tax=Mobula birostris TaxID=1983395 RepID=UPI003B2868BF
MWVPILLICSLPVSGALWAEKYLSGVVGRAITIDCYYEAKYRSHTKYWCHGWTLQCSVLVETNGQHRRSGRVSIADNPEEGIFTVTMEDVHSRDTGRYSCGITTPGANPMFSVYLQVSNAEQTTTQSMNTVNFKNKENHQSKSYLIWSVGRWLLFALLGICTISINWFMRESKKPEELSSQLGP